MLPVWAIHNCTFAKKTSALLETSGVAVSSLLTLAASGGLVYLFSNRREFLVRAASITAIQSQKDKSTDSPPTYSPGGDVKPPKLIHYVEPEFSSSSKEAFVEGVVKISTVVTAAGLPTELHVVSGLNTEEDNTALAAVKQWRFQPGTKDGHPVRVRVTVEINFHLL
jgi:TonB family protein